MNNTVLTIHRPLDDRQLEVRSEILLAARTLIHQHGHELVGMEMIAAEAGISRATMYRYFASKEHVICEAALAWGRIMSAQVQDAVSAAADLQSALDAAIDCIVGEANSDLPMVRATMISVLALGPTADAYRLAVREMFTSLLPHRARDLLQDHQMKLTLLGRLFFADLSLMSVGDLDPEQCVVELKAAAVDLLSAPTQSEGA